MSHEVTYPFDPTSGPHRGQFVAARPPRQSPARDLLPTTPPPDPAWTRSAEVAVTRDVIAEINRAADQRDALLASLFPVDVMRDANSLEPRRTEVDPASFRFQRDQAHESIRELLALYDAEKARADGLAAILAAYQCECGDMLIARPLWSQCGNCSAATS